MKPLARTGLLALVLLSWNLLAWNSTGHMAVALLAYEELSKNDTAWNAIVEILKQHPRLEDLKQDMPANAGEKEQWRYIFCKAATWPDMVRPKAGDGAVRQRLSAKYHHGEWHYINFPINLDD